MVEEICINFLSFCLSANRSQVTAMNVHKDNLYIATTWGCLVVVDKVTMETLNVVRCHGNNLPYVCAILTLNFDFASETEDDISSSSARTDDSSLSPADKLSESQSSSLILTVGKGFRDLVTRTMYVKPSSVCKEANRNDMYMAAWRTDGWEVNSQSTLTKRRM